MANITIWGDANGNTLTGTNPLDDYFLYGLGGNDTLTGNDGDDWLDGGTGNDVMRGGSGADVYIVDSLLDDVDEVGNGTVDRVEASVSWSLVPDANVEDLTLTGTADIDATGNARNNTLKGNSGDNVIDGGTGADTMSGGAGNDRYRVDNAGDTVTEAAASGYDTVTATVDFTLGANLESLDLDGGALQGTGNDLGNTILGNDLNNILNGKGGVDAMTGWLGNDTYYVDTLNDTTVEAANGGIDLVYSTASDYTLGANVENLVMHTQFFAPSGVNGTGNGLANVLTGNVLGNVLKGMGSNDTIHGLGGTDTLDGGSGNDVLLGGLLNDTYLVDSALDLVIELAGEGTDLVKSSVTYTITDTDVEDLTLTGTGSISGNGNAAVNAITGNSGANTLDGKGGADILTGKGGNDTYIVDNLGDAVIEVANEGTDLVNSAATHTLGINVENLTLTGVLAVNGTGNASNNVIKGNTGANVLQGGSGADTIHGGLGIDTLRGRDIAAADDVAQDKFVFDTTPNGLTNFDLIDAANFTAAGNEVTDDQIMLENTVFTNLLSASGGNLGTLMASQFHENEGDGSKSTDEVGIFYRSGHLFYNPTFGTANDSVLFATIGAGVTGPVTAEEFTLN